jgi:hypothetical protein
VFNVSSAAAIYPGTALLRTFQEMVRDPSASGLVCMTLDPAVLHPDQPTRFHIGWLTDEPVTRNEAMLIFENLTVTATWDDVHSTTLELQEILPYKSADKSERMKCRWTVR